MQRVTRLGEGQAAAGRLLPEPMRRTAAAVAEFARAARGLGATRVRIVATSAVREARNRGEFVARLEAESGESVEVISGEDEARLTLQGVTSGLPDLGDSFVLFDIGGGSTEFVLARAGGAAAAVSLRLGVVRLVEEWGEPGPVRWDRFARMREVIERRLAAEVPEAHRGGAGRRAGRHRGHRHHAGRARSRPARLRRGAGSRPPARPRGGGAGAGSAGRAVRRRPWTACRVSSRDART